jgi:hypothetical protein
MLPRMTAAAETAEADPDQATVPGFYWWWLSAITVSLMGTPGQSTPSR